MRKLWMKLLQLLGLIKPVSAPIVKPEQPPAASEPAPVEQPDPVIIPMPVPEPEPEPLPPAAETPVYIPPVVVEVPVPAPPVVVPPVYVPPVVEQSPPTPPVIKPPVIAPPVVSLPKTEYIKDYTPFPWGVAIKKTTTAGSATAKQLLLEGDCFVTENGVGMAALNPAEGKFTFGNIDSMLKAVNGKPLYIFHIIWGHADLPDFVLKASGNRALVEKHFKNYIQTLVNTYKGKIDKWVVVNEAFESNGTLKDCFWLRELGPEYIPLAFKYAHEANPLAEFILNDYDLEYNNKKVPAVVKYVQDSIKAGVPIHGIGSQMHTFSGLGTGTKLKEYRAALKSMVSTGLKIYISELDVAIKGNTDPNIAIQRTTYLEVAKGYTEIVPGKQQGGIFIWSLADDASYKNFDSAGKKLSPLAFFPALLMAGYARKPVYNDLLTYFKSLHKG